MARNCPVCGDLTCGCAECFSPRIQALKTYFGLCRNCTDDLAARVGEKSVSAGYALEGVKTPVQHGDQVKARRVLLALYQLVSAKEPVDAAV